MSDRISVWVGLGNDDESYLKTRHNVGWHFVDYVADHMGVSFQSHKDAYIAKHPKVCLVKLKSFMNLSGSCLKRVMNYFGWQMESLLVAYDELDFPLGTTRLKFDGGAGGHNGITSIVDAYGRKDFWRLRLGIRGDFPEFEHKGHKMAFVTKYVLTPFKKKETMLVHQGFDTLVPNIELMVNNPQLAMNHINQKV